VAHLPSSDIGDPHILFHKMIFLIILNYFDNFEIIELKMFKLHKRDYL
jgi:hypothetical protein